MQSGPINFKQPSGEQNSEDHFANYLGARKIDILKVDRLHR